MRGFPGGSGAMNLPVSAGDTETQVQSLGWEDPLEKEMQPTPVFLPGEFHGQRSLAGYSHGFAESDTIEHACIRTHRCSVNFSLNE